MAVFASPWALVIFVALILSASVAMVLRRTTVAGFYDGADAQGDAPGLWTLVLSQVTTWIFARSLMNAAILGYFYGVAGTLAYMAYYLSFLTGGFIIARLRAGGARSVQGWLGAHFGATGHVTYNIVVALRLLSEVFANLVVARLIFAAAFPATGWAGTGAIVALAGAGLIYSALGGLRASLRTDVLQMAVFLVVFVIAFAVMVTGPEFSLSAVLSAPGVHEQGARPGWVLLAVAFLQVFSYPAHDPVMMDRGFIAGQARTNASFLHAFWISSLCIFGFGMFGIQAGLMGADYRNELLGTWAVMFGPGVYFLIAASLLVSAVSTLDSALASAARLVIDELRLAPRTVGNGRIVMVAFMAGGAALTLWDNRTLFDAVAVTGTASMFLTPVLGIAFFTGRVVPRWSYIVAWTAAMAGAAAYLYRDSALVAALFAPLPVEHKYDQLLYICIAVLATGFIAGLSGVAGKSNLAGRAGA